MESESRGRLLKGLDTRTKVLALVGLIAEALFLGSLAKLPSDQTLYALISCAVILVVMVLGIVFLESRGTGPRESDTRLESDQINFAKIKARRKQYGSLVGVWVEANDLLDDRPFAICEFYFSPSDGKLKFKGDSYDNKGNPYYTWTSIVLHIDDKAQRMSYIYETQQISKIEKKEGFGCIFLQFDQSSNTSRALRGYFLDLQEAKPRFSRMLRFEAVTGALKRDLEASNHSDRQSLVRELIKQKDSASLKKLFGWS